MKHRDGRIEIVCGSMFSGKTEELLRRVRRAEIAKQKVQLFKPQLDNRYSEDNVTSHNGTQNLAENIEASRDILRLRCAGTNVIAVDEAQFIDDGLVDVALRLASEGVRVIVAGLDMDFRGEPFGTVPHLMAVAEDVTKLHAICVVCGEDASHTQRLVNNRPAYYEDPIILVGATESYEARCRKCHQVPHVGEQKQLI
jgi:thymidine kinase